MPSALRWERAASLDMPCRTRWPEVFDDAVDRRSRPRSAAGNLTLDHDCLLTVSALDAWEVGTNCCSNVEIRWIHWYRNQNPVFWRVSHIVKRSLTFLYVVPNKNPLYKLFSYFPMLTINMRVPLRVLVLCLWASCKWLKRFYFIIFRFYSAFIVTWEIWFEWCNFLPSFGRHSLIFCSHDIHWYSYS